MSLVGTLYVTVLSGRNVFVKDASPADSYVEVEASGCPKRKTKTVPKCDSPQWEQEPFVFRDFVKKDDKDISIRCFHKAKLSPKCLGDARIRLSDLDLSKEVARWVSLHSKSERENNVDVRVLLLFEPDKDRSGNLRHEGSKKGTFFLKHDQKQASVRGSLLLTTVKNIKAPPKHEDANWKDSPSSGGGREKRSRAKPPTLASTLAGGVPRVATEKPTSKRSSSKDSVGSTRTSKSSAVLDLKKNKKTSSASASPVTASPVLPRQDEAPSSPAISRVLGQEKPSRRHSTQLEALAPPTPETDGSRRHSSHVAGEPVVDGLSAYLMQAVSAEGIKAEHWLCKDNKPLQVLWEGRYLAMELAQEIDELKLQEHALPTAGSNEGSSTSLIQTINQRPALRKENRNPFVLPGSAELDWYSPEEREASAGRAAPPLPITATANPRLTMRNLNLRKKATCHAVEVWELIPQAPRQHCCFQVQNVVISRMMPNFYICSCCDGTADAHTRRLSVWSTETGTELFSDTTGVLVEILTGGEPYFVIIENDNTVWVYDTSDLLASGADGMQKRKAEVSMQAADCYSYGMDCKYLVCGSFGNASGQEMISFWDLSRGKRLALHNDKVRHNCTGVEVRANLAVTASAVVDEHSTAFKIWDLEDVDAPLWEWSENQRYTSMALQSECLFVALPSGVHCYDVVSLEARLAIPAKRSTCIAAGGYALFTGHKAVTMLSKSSMTERGSVAVWNTTTQAKLADIPHCPLAILYNNSVLVVQTSTGLLVRHMPPI